MASYWKFICRYVVGQSQIIDITGIFFLRLGLSAENLYAFLLLGFYRMLQNKSFRRDFARNVSLGVLSMAGQSLFILADTFFIANMNIIAIAIFTGIGQGIQPLISTSYGAKKYDIVTKTLRYGILTSFITGLIIFLCGLFFSPEIVSVFNGDNNATMASIAEPALRIYFSSFLFTGVNFVVIFFTASIGRSRISMLISLLRGLILIIPTLYILKSLLGIKGVWLTMLIVEIITLSVSVLYFKKL